MLQDEEAEPVFKTKIRLMNFDKSKEDDGFGKECLLVKTERGVARSCGESVQRSPWDSICQKNISFFDGIFPPLETLSYRTYLGLWEICFVQTGV